jgi:hypothetical protein
MNASTTTHKSIGKRAAVAAAVAATALAMGGLTTAYAETTHSTALAAQSSPAPVLPVDVSVQPTDPSVEALDCWGSTGSMGCGAGWFWRAGWRGWGCYPC